MPSVSFFPTKDSDLLLWAQNFSTRTTATPLVYGISSAQCTAFAALLTTFSTDLAACAPDVRCKSAVTAKNNARDAMKANAKLLANIINGQATVTDAQKQQLGLNVRSRPSPIPVPSSSPALEIGVVDGWTVNFKLHDSAVGSKRGKPAGVSGASIFSYVGTTPPSEVSGWVFEGNTGAVKNVVQFKTSVPAGALVWLTAFWFNPRKESGPACRPVSINLQGGSVQMAA